MGASMFFMQMLNPPPPDPMQAKIMKWMPIVLPSSSSGSLQVSSCTGW